MTRRALWISICALLATVGSPLAAEDRTRGATVTDWGGADQQDTHQRLALVIGNGAYQNMDPLRNPPNDVTLIAASLEDVGFAVRLLVDITRRQMDAAVEEFALQLDEAGRKAVGLFYYAGHAVSYGGRNWLLPVNANISQAADIEYESISSGWVLGLMEGARNATDIMVLDSCRDSPFRGFSLSGTRSLSRGLVTMDAPSGSFIAYSTAPGQVAYDGTGDYSPFAAAFATEIKRPDFSIGDMMIEVTRRVKQSTRDLGPVEQVPWTHSSLDARFAFSPVRAPNDGDGTSATVLSDIEMTIWQSIETSTDPAEFEAYLNKYPEGSFASIARVRLRRLSQAPEANRTREAGAAAPPDTAPDFSVAALDFRGIVNTAADVFSAPDRLSSRQRRVAVGYIVRVTGRVENRLWYRLILDDGEVGYISMSAVDRL
jgi:hypothetical protein